MTNRIPNFLAAAALAALATIATVPQAGAHCQVPCGIYDDGGVLAKMHTDYLTIAKASKMIPELLGQDPVANAHQVGRWIMTKEKHAQDIQDTVANYFLAQRLKLDEATSDNQSYLRKLTLCHQVIVAAMKCKQSTDQDNVTKLHDLLAEFDKLFGPKK